MKKSTMVRLTALEFFVAILVSIAAVDAYDCHMVFVVSLGISILWFIIFSIANGILN